MDSTKENNVVKSGMEKKKEEKKIKAIIVFRLESGFGCKVIWSPMRSEYLPVRSKKKGDSRVVLLSLEHVDGGKRLSSLRY